jgi:uncharacterized protein (DUF433 family)
MRIVGPAVQPVLIRRTPGVCGGVACVRETGVPVWLLVRLKQLGRAEADLLSDHPGLTAADLDAVWAYYRERTAEIEADIAADERDGGGDGG